MNSRGSDIPQAVIWSAAPVPRPAVRRPHADATAGALLTGLGAALGVGRYTSGVVRAAGSLDWSFGRKRGLRERFATGSRQEREILRHTVAIRRSIDNLDDRLWTISLQLV